MAAVAVAVADDDDDEAVMDDGSSVKGRKSH